MGASDQELQQLTAKGFRPFRRFTGSPRSGKTRRATEMVAAFKAAGREAVIVHCDDHSDIVLVKGNG